MQKRCLNEYWTQVRDTQNADILKRNLEGYKRIARCMARLSLQTHVTKNTAIETMNYLNAVLKPLINELRIVRSAEDELFYQLVEYVRARKKKAVVVRGAVTDIVSKDKRLLDYITAADKHRTLPLEQDKNERYNKLCGSIQDHPYILV
jgi:DNA replicative helicase MCM subunit Mcm2 (Cdc46/Mcm family)